MSRGSISLKSGIVCPGDDGRGELDLILFLSAMRREEKG
jgi:hypothetical protein